MRSIAVVILLLSSMLWAETQEATFFRALQAEESGDIILAIQCFEEALSVDGPYFDEIAEILNEYYEALGIPLAKRSRYLKNEKTVDAVNPWSFRFLGELGTVGVHYSASSADGKWGGILQGSVASYVDYTVGSNVHSLGLNLFGNFNFNNDDVLALDTNDWMGTLGMEYSLVGENLLLNVGADLNFYEQESVNPAFFFWLEYDFFKRREHQVGVALWAYYDMSGPLSVALYGVWQKTSTLGFGFSVMVGPKFDVDSTFDYQAYEKEYENALDNVEQEMDRYTGYENGSNPFEHCIELYGERCFGWSIATIDSLNWVSKFESLMSNIDIKLKKYWAKWIGPSLKVRAYYRFKNQLSLEAKMNLFYGFVVDGPDQSYEEISKFSGVWSGFVNWNIGVAKLYFGVEDSYKQYGLPSLYSKIYPEHSNVLKIKIGSKWEF